MKLRVEATAGELEERPQDLLRAAADYVRPFMGEEPAHALLEGETDPEIRELLVQAIPLAEKVFDRIMTDAARILGRDPEDIAKARAKAELPHDDTRLHELRESVNRHIATLIRDVAGRDAMTAEEQQDAALTPVGLGEESEPLVVQAYKLGGEGDVLGAMTAAHEAAASLRGLGHRLTAQLIANASAVLLERSALSNLARRIRDGVVSGMKDLKRLLQTLAHRARRSGLAATLARMHGHRAHVYKQPQPGACPDCVVSYTGPDGFPRIFALDVLEAFETNAGRHRTQWAPTAGPMHPFCRCTGPHHVPEGWGFNEEGELTPDGEGGLKYGSDESLAYGRESEEELQRAFRVRGEVNYQGIPIAIEHPAGTMRPWRTPGGQSGETLMRFGYGYAKRTEGADGEGYDVFVGPDPQAYCVYIFHTKTPGSEAGDYDEDKAFLGFANPIDARLAFDQHFTDPRSFGSMSEMSVDAFKETLAATRRPDHDGMAKAEPEVPLMTLPIKPGYIKSTGGVASQHIGAQDSRMGDRAVVQGSSGLNIAIGVPSLPMHHAHKPGYVSERRRKEGEYEHDRHAVDKHREGILAWRTDAALTGEKVQHPLKEWEDRARVAEEPGDARANYKEQAIDQWVERRELARVRNKLPPVRLIMRPGSKDGQHSDDEDKAIKKPKTPKKDEKKNGQTVKASVDPLWAKAVKKRGLGEVELAVLADGTFRVHFPGGPKRCFMSLSAACDEVWAVAKGYITADDYRNQKATNKVPSGAGWRFWGVSPEDAPVLPEIR